MKVPFRTIYNQIKRWKFPGDRIQLVSDQIRLPIQPVDQVYGEEDY